MPEATAAAAFVRAVRKFAVQTPLWGTAVRYFTKPDERYDATLIAQRVYGDRSEFLVIFAAAGLDTFEQITPEQQLVLPTASQLNALKIQTGYMSDEELAIYNSLD